MSEHLRNSVFIDGDFEFKGSVSTEKLTFDSLMQTFMKLYYSCLDSIADSAFNDLNLR
jgi:hypothetical protein